MAIDLPSFVIPAGELLQHVSRVTYRQRPLHYGRDGTNRYDAARQHYGVLYLGRDYSITQHVSEHIHAMRPDPVTPAFDGLLYPARNNYPATSVALFDRAETKITVIEDIDLADHVEWPAFVSRYRIGVEPDPGPVDQSDGEILD